jgi:hypothetical protein
MLKSLMVLAVLLAVSVTPRSANAMLTNTTSGPGQIENAQSRHNWIFGAYVLLLALTVAGTYFVWSSGNKVQDTIQADANARIEEAKSTAASANERSKSLEHDNLALRTDLNAEIGKLAALQKDASNAKAAQQKVQTELAAQQERAAKAEKELSELKEAVRPRRLTKEQQDALVKLLSSEPRGPVELVCVMGDGEGYAFAMQIDSVLKAAGWTVQGGGVAQAAYSGGNPTGFGIVVRNGITAPQYAARIQRAFFSIGIPLAGAELADRPEGAVMILVGNKPNRAK